MPKCGTTILHSQQHRITPLPSALRLPCGKPQNCSRLNNSRWSKLRAAMGKKMASWPRPDINDLVGRNRVPGDSIPGDAVRSFCPCHAGWELFEQNVVAVLRHLRDPDRRVRADALHVFEDAARMQLAADLKYSVEPGETKIGEKRASGRYRSIQERLEARRERKRRRQKPRRGSAFAA